MCELPQYYEKKFQTTYLGPYVIPTLWGTARDMSEQWGQDMETTYAVFAQFAAIVSGARGFGVVEFLRAECLKFERAYDEHIASHRPAEDDLRLSYDLKQERLSAKVSLLRTLIAYIERGDDMVPR